MSGPRPADAAARARPRLVATDLDGTLLRSDGTVSPRTRAVLVELDRIGIPVVFVTGRPIRWMESLWEDVGGHGIALLSNGAVVYDVARHEIRTAHRVEPELAIEVATRLRHGVPGTSFGVEKTTGFALEPSFFAGESKPADIAIGGLEELLDDQVVKLLAQHAEIAPEPFWEQVEAVVGDLITTTWSSSWALVEMSAPGVTKASALADVAAGLGISADEIVAFGDMPNDVALLGWAGRSFAMANAHPLALAAAAETAPTNDEDGVAVTLAGIFGLGVV
ncbi:MAG: HAD-IIB family hydrolase [Nocardioides sp.]